MNSAPVVQRVNRPTKPPPSLAAPIGLVAFLIISWFALSEEFGIGLDIDALIENAGRGLGIWSEFLEPDWAFLPETFGPMLETFQMAVISAFVGCAIALPVSFLASRVTSPNLATYLADRGVLSVIRAIPDILYALIFVAAVSIGPLAGMLALVFFNIGVVAKLLSETVDGVDTGPIEATRAAGANRLQTTRWAVMPQILPNYVAYSLYTFELNIRASTVIGIVGAGGIGQLLNAQRTFFQYDNLAVIILELFVFVFAIELFSIWVRRKLV
ncbi:MAG: phosphonate ABC transporter, permease protein PhnE [Chloroflexota bacterium]|nr:phosphonate ABC transporter, permease protein PhnE [Chloroflexota bacterium]